MTRNAAILYHPEGYTTSGDRLMGRHAAGEGFLSGYFRHAEVDRFYAYSERQEHFRQFQQDATAGAGTTPSVWIPQTAPERLAEAGALYIPGPDLANAAWIRRVINPTGWSLSGVTHTICSDRIMDAIGNLMIAPLEPWDAIICTSTVVKSSLERVLLRHSEYLAERLGAKTQAPRLQLPVIPLGVNCDAFAPSAAAEEYRTKLRARLGIGPDDVVSLFMGRLSYHAKAHPLPMYLGLEAAAKATGKKTWLIQAGWFANDSIEKEFVEGARQYCPTVNALFLDGRKPEIRQQVWFAADIFISLSDNIQETFGISPIEAMAAGLPVVVSDWNGYRDTVQQGVVGYRIPTVMPAAGNGTELARGFQLGQDTYDRYIGHASQCVAVDVVATGQALTRLVADPALRREMGAAGRALARERYDWGVIIPQYQDLWGELAERRATVANETHPPRLSPHRGDPFSLFCDYPTHVLAGNSAIRLRAKEPEQAIKRLLQRSMNNFAARILLNERERQRLFEVLGQRSQDSGPETKTTSFDAVAAEFPPERHAALQCTVAWLAKMGLISVAPAGPPPKWPWE